MNQDVLEENVVVEMKALPITVGIIGHRDAILTKDHFSKLEKVFDDLHTKYFNSPIVLYSQLAEGVDTAVADYFLSLKERTGRAYSLVVPLPFDLKHYRSTFAESELSKFDSLLKRADRYFVINGDGGIPVNDLYRKGGQFVADNSLILIAFWDWIDNHKVGGTADIVNYKMQGLFSEDSLSANYFEPKGSLISISCNRQSSSEKREIRLVSNYLDQLLEDTSIEKALSKIEEINRLNWKVNQLELSQHHLYPKDDSLSPMLKNLRYIYSILDVSALNNQKAYKRILNSLFALALVVISIYQTYTQVGLHQNIFIAIVAVLGIMFLVFNFSGQWKNHKKYLEDRMLAEALRIQFFWNVSGLAAPVSRYILQVYKSELSWIKHLLNCIYGWTYENKDENLIRIKQVKSHWIEHQHKYFGDKVHNYKSQIKKFDTISYIFLFIAIAVLFSIFVVNQMNSEHSWLKGLIIFDTIIFGSFCLTKGYYEKRGYDQIRNQHELMKAIYKSANEGIDLIMEGDLTSESKYQKIQEFLLIIGKEALNENGYWYTIFKEKEPEIEGFGV